MSERLTLHSPRRPNVVWIFGDQHRVHATSYRGDGNVFTPNIDNLAREGMRFDCAVAGAPWCTPFRGALLTGRYPHQSGVVANGCPLPPELPTVAHAFDAAGYHTAYVGKWHLDGTNDRDHYVPPERRGGFHYWMGNDAANNQHECYAFGTDSETPQRLRGYETDAWSDLLIEHLRSHVGDAGSDRGDADYQPFFSVLSVQPPHGPNVPPTNPVYGAPRLHPATLRLRRNVPDVPWIQERTRLGLAGYYAMVENLDYNIGQRSPMRAKFWHSISRTSRPEVRNMMPRYAQRVSSGFTASYSGRTGSPSCNALRIRNVRPCSVNRNGASHSPANLGSPCRPRRMMGLPSSLRQRIISASLTAAPTVRCRPLPCRGLAVQKYIGWPCPLTAAPPVLMPSSHASPAGQNGSGRCSQCTRSRLRAWPQVCSLAMWSANGLIR